MPSKTATLLSVIEARLSAIAPTYRALEGRALTLDDAARMPIIALRLTQDQPLNMIGKTSVVILSLTIDGTLRASDTPTPDADLADLLYAIRSALIDADETPPLKGTVMGNGITFEAASYGYPDSGSDLVVVRQPITLRFSENYRGAS